jgi:hypothetical protein
MPTEEEAAAPVFLDAMEAYIAQAKAKQEVPNNRGLMKFTREKLIEAGFGEMLKPTKREKPKHEFKEPNPELDWVWLGGHVSAIIKREWDAKKIAAQIPEEILASELDEYKKAVEILNQVITEIETLMQASPHENRKSCYLHQRHHPPNHPPDPRRTW